MKTQFKIIGGLVLLALFLAQLACTNFAYYECIYLRGGTWVEDEVGLTIMERCDLPRQPTSPAVLQTKDDEVPPTQTPLPVLPPDDDEILPTQTSPPVLPPEDDEVQSTQISPAVLPTEGGQALPSVCVEKGLTADECTGLGKHSFKIVSCTVPQPGCVCGDTVGVLEFSGGNELTLQFTGRAKMFFEKQGPNLYEFVSFWGADRVSTHVVWFTTDGFQLQTEVRSQTSNELSCLFNKVAVFDD